MLAILDYGVGNLFSLKSSFAFIGKEVTVTSDPKEIRAASRLILPGVGAFGDAARKLKEKGLDEVLIERASAGIPIMGICLGMQLLLESSTEYGFQTGLGLIPGEVRAIEEVIPKDFKIPHIGWNSLQFQGKVHPIFRYIKNGDSVYFVHSYYGTNCMDSVIATAEYGAPLTAAIAKGNVCGCQFHPEKSGKVGLDILRGFCEWEGEE